ncbi:MAG: hypothetical protein RM338_03695 [Nostoc sp. DedQUE12a]|nr:hypothetical protein [Nostoc sp. DedQUE12a]
MAKVERESINFKLPKPLAEALRAAAKERNTTATDLVIQGLHHVLGAVDGVESDVENRLDQIESSLSSKFEAKLEAVTIKLAQLEGAMMILQRNQNTARGRKSAYSNYYSGQSPQLMPFKEENLILRLVTDVATLRSKRETLSQSEFVRWCKDRDPSSVGWQYDENDGLYHPVK